MAALQQYLVSQNLEQPKPKLVPSRKSTQALAVEGIHHHGRIRVEIRPHERRRTHVLLGTINHCDFRVIKPIPVHLELRGKNVVAAWRQADEYGTGKTMSTACDDLGRTLAELYTSLKVDESRLGPDLARVWSILKEHIAPREHPVRP